MLSDEEKREMLELASSEQIREEFRALKEASRGGAPLDVDALIRFLSTMSRLAPARPREFVEYKRVLL